MGPPAARHSLRLGVPHFTDVGGDCIQRIHGYRVGFVPRDLWLIFITGSSSATTSQNSSGVVAGSWSTWRGRGSHLRPFQSPRGAPTRPTRMSSMLGLPPARPHSNVKKGL